MSIILINLPVSSPVKNSYETRGSADEVAANKKASSSSSGRGKGAL